MFRSDRRSRRRVAIAVALGAALFVPTSRGLVAPAAAQGRDDGDATQKARAEFVTATEHVKNARWSEALGAFERSAALRPHALTTFNIGACERALGRYTRARQALKRALEFDEAAKKRELPRSFNEEAKRWLAELDGILVRATVTLSPSDTVLLVDGAPLVVDEGEQLVANMPGATSGVRAPGPRFTMVIDPGDHIFALSRAGFVNAVLNKTFAPGSKPKIDLDLKSLPATIRITANRPGAVVSVDDLDTGIAPVELSRPAGSYRVTVRKSGFVPYATTVRVHPGDQPTMQATLSEETKSVFKSVWFWSAAAVVVAGAATTTYFLTRPEPERPPPDGGGVGWVVSVPAPGAR